MPPVQCNLQLGLRQGGYTFRLLGLTFINTTRRVMWTPPYKEILLDLDGSLTGLAGGGWVMPMYKWNRWTPMCVAANTTFDSGIVCDSSVTVRRLQISGVNPSQLDYQVPRTCKPASAAHVW